MDIICSFQDNQIAVNFVRLSEFLPDVVAVCHLFKDPNRQARWFTVSSTGRRKSVQAGRSAAAMSGQTYLAAGGP
jgi:hypothetical protein